RCRRRARCARCSRRRVRGADLHLPAGSWDEITPASAGWSFCGLRVLHLAPGDTFVLDTADREYAVLPLAGSVAVRTNEYAFALEGRESVFARVSDWAYLPMRTHSH